MTEIPLTFTQWRTAGVRPRPTMVDVTVGFSNPDGETWLIRSTLADCLELLADLIGSHLTIYAFEVI